MATPEGSLSRYLLPIGIVLASIGALSFVLSSFLIKNKQTLTIARWYSFLLLATGGATAVVSLAPVHVWRS